MSADLQGWLSLRSANLVVDDSRIGCRTRPTSTPSCPCHLRRNHRRTHCHIDRHGIQRDGRCALNVSFPVPLNRSSFLGQLLQCRLPRRALPFWLGIQTYAGSECVYQTLKAG
ncbi:hypothetical protein BD309DRAFT_206156 [Dichomitus squalens]|nr:hypothetical protein BD309DRAFT_206156 [Dichomitus squalens]